MIKRWKPENDEVYYYVFGNGYVAKTVWKNSPADKILFEHGNCFKTKEEAEAAAKKVKALLLSLHYKETSTANDESLPDWCKVGAWGYDTADACYFEIVGITAFNVDVAYIGKDWRYNIGVNVFNDNYKPARLRPYNAEEMKALVGKVIEDKDKAHLVCAFDKTIENIETLYAFFDAQRLLDSSFTVDGKPCGVLEHLENGEWIK